MPRPRKNKVRLGIVWGISDGLQPQPPRAKLVSPAELGNVHQWLEVKADCSASSRHLLCAIGEADVDPPIRGIV
jgi:hypothetical protein